MDRSFEAGSYRLSWGRASGNGAAALPRMPVALGLLHVDRLEIDLPLPAPAGGGTNAPGLGVQQRARGRLDRLELSIEQAAIDARLQQLVPALAKLGVLDVRMQLRDGEIELGARIRVGAHEAELAGWAYLAPGEGATVRCVLGELRVHGQLPIAAAEVGPILFTALGARRAGGLQLEVVGRPRAARLVGATEAELDLLGHALFATLPLAGFRLPDVANVRALAVRLMAGRIQAVFGRREGAAPGSAVEGSARVLAEAAARAAEGVAAAESALVLGDARAALDAYARLAADPRARALARRRRLELLAVYGDAREASRLAGTWAGEEPANPAPLVLNASLALRSGDAVAAGHGYLRAAAVARSAGEVEGEARALLGGARLLLRDAPEAAALALEQLSAAQPDHDETLLLLAAALDASSADERRLAALTRLATIAEARGAPAAAARALGELGRALLSRGETRRAHEILVQAFDAARSAGTEAPAALAALALAAAAVGAEDDARQALERLVALAGSTAELSFAEAACRLADVYRGEGKEEAALRLYERAEASAAPDEAGRLAARIGELRAARGEAETAAQAFVAAAKAAAGASPADAAVLWLRAGELYRRVPGREGEARETLERALALDPSSPAATEQAESFFGEAGDLAGVAAVLARRVEAAGARPQEQCALLLRLAGVEEKLGRRDQARSAHERALAIDETHVPSLLWLGRDAMARGDRTEALTRLGALLEVGAGAAEPLPPEALRDQAETHEQAAALALGGGDPALAERHLRAALDLDPRRRGPLEKLTDLLRASHGRDAELADALAALAATVEDRETAALLEMERAEALARASRSDVEIAAAYARAAELAPTLDQPLAQLAEIHARAGRHIECAAMHERRAELARARGDELAAVRFEVEAARASGDQGRVEGGLARMMPLLPAGSARAAVVLERAQRALGRGDVNAARALLAAEAAVSASPDVARLLAEIDTRLELGRWETSGPHTQSGARPLPAPALAPMSSPVPGPLPAVPVSGVASHEEDIDPATLDGLRATGRALEFARTLEERAHALATGGDSHRASRIFYTVGLLYLEDGRDAEHAAGVLERALVLSPQDGAVLAKLEEALRPLGEHARLAGALELHLGRIAGAARIEPLSRLAELYAQQLDDRDRAGLLWAEVLALDPSRTDLLVPLGDHHFARGEASPALDYYGRALSLAQLPARERARLRQRIGDLVAEAGQDKKAEQWYRRALDDEPALEEALAGLERIFRRRGNKGDLAFVLVARAGLAPAGLAAAFLREAAQLYAEGGRQGDADGLRQRVVLLEARADASTAAGSQAGGAAAEEDIVAALRMIEAELGYSEGPRRAALLVELASLLGGTVGDLDAAEQCLREAVELDPTSERAVRAYADVLGRLGKPAEMCRQLTYALEHLPLSPEAEAALAIRLGHACAEGLGDLEAAIAAFERAAAKAELPLDARETVAGLYRATGRYRQLAAALEALAESERGPRRLAWLSEAAELVAQEGADLQRAADLYARLFREDPNRRDAGARARRLYLAEQDFAAAEAVAAAELATARPEERAALRAARAAILIRLGRVGEADVELQAALIAAPELGTVHLELGRLCAARGETEAALYHLDAALADQALDTAVRSDAAHSAGHLQERAGRAGLAIERYELASSLDPTDRRPLERLERLYEEREDLPALTEVLGRLVLVSPDRAERARIWHRRALLYRDRLAREPEAYRCLKEAAANDPAFVPALADLRALAEARGEWALAAELYYGEIAQVEDDSRRAALHAQLGLLMGERMLDHEQAIRNLEQALSLDPSLEGASDALAEAYAHAGREEDALRRWDELARSAPDARTRGRYLVRMAERLEAMGRVDEARAKLNAVVEASADAPAADAGGPAARHVERLPAGRGQDDDERPALVERLREADDPGERAEILRRLIRLAADGGDDREAEARARELLDLVPSDNLAFDVRKRILRARADDRALEGLLTFRVEHAGEPRARADALFELARLAESRGQASRAASLYEQALQAEPDHVATLETLADQAYRRRDLQRARDLYAKLGGRRAHVAEDVVAFRLGETEEVAGNLEAAREFYRAAVAANPAHVAALQGVARITLHGGDPPAAIAALKEVLVHLPLDAVDRITEVRQQLGDLLVQLGDDAAAKGYFELVLAQEPDRIDALAPLCDIYQRMGAWPRAGELLGRLASLTASSTERAEMLLREGDVYRERLGDYERAGACYLKAIDLAPDHVPTLARLVDYAWSVGDLAMMMDVGKDLRRRDPEAERSAELAAQLALALVFANETPADAASHLARAFQLGLSPERAGALLAHVTGRVAETGRDLARLDTALSALAVAAGSVAWDEQLAANVAELLAGDPGHAGARHVLARMASRRGDTERARGHLSILAFLGDDNAGALLGALPPAPRPPASLSPWALVPAPAALAPLLHGLAALARPLAMLGAMDLPPGANPLYRPGLFDEVAGELGVPDLQAATVTGALFASVLPGRPLWLLVGDAALALPEPELRFLAARALALWRVGDTILEGRDGEELARLLRMVAPRVTGRREAPEGGDAEDPELLALLEQAGLPPRDLPPGESDAVWALARAAGPGLDVDGLRAVLREEADRLAWRCAGDAAAALSVLAQLEGLPIESREEREAAVRSAPGPRALVDSLDGRLPRAGSSR